MDRSPADRLPTGRIPGLGSDDETEPTDEDVDTADGSPEIELEEPDEKPPLRVRIRKLLLGVSLGGLGLAVLAALLRRVLGGDHEPDDAVEQETDEDAVGLETDEPEAEAPDEDVESVSDLLTADAEGAAALVGLGFNLLVRALVDDTESESPTASSDRPRT